MTDGDITWLDINLELARSGTAYFRERLDELSDDDLDAPSALPGWSRRHVIAHVGYNARGLNRLVHWASTGEPTAMYPSQDARDAEIEQGAAQPAQQLRELVAGSAADLDAGWRTLTDEQWRHPVQARGATVPAAETARMRARETWLHAVDLDSGASYEEFPPEFVDVLLAFVVGNWRTAGAGDGLELVPDDRDAPILVSGPAEVRLSGSAAALARWITGRGSDGIRSSTGSVPDPAPWQ
jgi:maleylpyruvate isomerase